MDFNRYFNNDELEEFLKKSTSNYPTIFSYAVIGKSYENRPIWAVTLTNQAKGADTEKPAVWIDANIHATEIAGTTTVLYFINRLLTEYGRNSAVTRLLDEAVYYIVPRVNPDGAALSMAAKPKFIRSGVRWYPWEDKDEGLHPEDIDGDGRILQMRILDPNGDWKVSSLDARLMEKRLPEEHGGTYYRLLPEGPVKDYDGYLIKIAKPWQGLDFNRNFPFEWRPEDEQTGAGPYPTSEPEIKTLVDFITTHPNINLGITFHTYSRVILRPYSTRPDEDMDTDDLWVYKKIGERGSKLTGYPCVSIFHDFKYHPKEVVTGGFDDWLYDHLGIFCYTVELWDLPAESGIKDRKFIEWYRDHPHEDDLKILYWIDSNAKSSFVDWYLFNHPQLGTIELGGWDVMYTWRNPPHTQMEKEAVPQADFLLALGDMLPRLSIYNLDVKPLGNDDYHVNLVIENGGFLPTFTSHQAKKRKATRPVRLELELPEGVELINGKRRVELTHLEGRSNKLDVTMVGDAGPTDNRARYEWVIRAPEGSIANLNIISERAGVIHRELYFKG